MKRTLFAALAFAMMVGVAIVLPLSSAHAIEAFAVETETKIYKPDKSYNGYFMPVPYQTGTHYLMDMWGNVVHQFDTTGMVPQIAPDGTIWSIAQIQDWNGNVLWDFVPTRDAPTHPVFTMHHDMKRIWNKKLNQWTQLIVANQPITKAQADAAGGDPSISAAAYGTRLTAYDFVIEVNMAKQIVWEWHFIDHTVQSKNPTWANYVSDVKLKPGRFDVQWMTDNQRPNGQVGFVNDWCHVNSVDFNDEIGHVVINPKHFSQFVVVDHDKTFVSTTDFALNKAAAAGPDGDIIFRWGNPSMYNAGAAPGWMSEGDSQGYGWHQIQFIQPYHWARPRLATDKWPDPAYYTASGVALPGAGNFIIFDNGCYNPTRIGSRVIEINGRIGASGTEEVPKGQYVWPDVAGYKPATGNYQRRISKQNVWSFQAGTLNSFYSQAQSGMQRLPNGNTSINSAGPGHMFEVTPSGEVVWEYQYPRAVAGTTVIMRTVGSDGNNAWQVDTPGTKGALYSYRHYRYGADHPGLAGKDLTPRGTLTGLAPRLIGEGRTQQEATYGFGLGSRFGGGGGGGAGAGSGGGGGY
jgi:hypothetical protein